MGKRQIYISCARSTSAWIHVVGLNWSQSHYFNALPGYKSEDLSIDAKTGQRMVQRCCNSK